MRKHLKTIIGASVVTVGLVAAPFTLYAHEEGSGMVSGNSGNLMGKGLMMGPGAGGMMGGPSGMMGMMQMMSEMSRMMEICNNMMQSGSQAPNSQFHKPATQPQKG